VREFRNVVKKVLVGFLCLIFVKSEPSYSYEDPKIQKGVAQVTMRRGVKKLVVTITVDLEDEAEATARVEKLIKEVNHPFKMEVDVSKKKMVKENRGVGRKLGGISKYQKELERTYEDKQKNIFGFRRKNFKKYSPTPEDIRKIRLHEINLSAERLQENQKKKEKEKHKEIEEKLKMNGPRQRIPIIPYIKEELEEKLE
jgi:hypothetical protein